MATTADILRATLSGAMLDSVTWNLVFHYRVISGTELNNVTIANAIEAQLALAFVALEAELHNNVAADSLTLAIYDFIASEFDGIAQVNSSAINGAAAFQGLPNGTGVLLRWPTLELRRQARKFIPGLHENAAFDNNVGGVVIAAAATTAAILNNTFTAGALLLHPCTFNVEALSPRFETSSLFSTTDFFVNTQPGYQRNRQPGAGI